MSGRAAADITLPPVEVVATREPTTAKGTPSIGPLDPRQRFSPVAEIHETSLDNRQSQMHTALPGTIVSYNPAKMTVTVQIAVQGVQRMMDGTRNPVTIEPIADVPVCFPGGGAHIMTFPVAPGDDCLIVFSERSIDNWYQHAAVMPPSDWRMHDINDAFVLVGVRAQPHVLGGGGALRSGTPASPSTAMFRSDDGKTVVQVDGPNTAITLYASGGNETVIFVDGVGGQVTINAPQGMKINAPYLHVSGAVIAGFGGGDQIGLQSHSHHQPGDSHGDSEVAVNPPTPGS